MPVRDIAAVIGRRLGVPLEAKSVEQAADHFGRLGLYPAIDSPTSSTLTRQRLGWHPSQPGLIADIDRPRYFAVR